MAWRVIAADCIEAMQAMDEASVDAVVTDPPYGLHFMGKTWDRFGGPTGKDNTTHSERGGAMHAGNYDLSLGGQHGFQAEAFRWGEAMLRVLKPGGHAVVFGGTRTYHRLACALEDAGFEIRDCLAWMFGSGFPKSLDVSKAIDKAAGAEPDRVTETPDAERWQGWGTALKPAYEPIVLARKPLAGTVAANVLAHGTGALNIDGTRIETYAQAGTRRDDGWGMQRGEAGEYEQPSGRWPANVVLDEDAAAMLDDTGGASRFFYTSKASSAEREAGFEYVGQIELQPAGVKNDSGRGFSETDPYAAIMRRNNHPTVKPVDLMQWLCRLVTPPGGTVLDPFTGSGSTGIAALREGFEFIGVEREPEYVEIARARIIGDAPLFNVESEVGA